MTKGRSGAYGRVLRYVAPYRWQFVSALVCMAIVGASDGAIPFLIKHILDGVFADQDATLLYLLPGLIVVFALLRASSDFGQQFLMARVGHYVVRDVRNDLNAHLLRLSPSYFVEQSSANLLSHITSDVVMVRSALTDSFAGIIHHTIRIVALLATAFYLDPVLALIAFVVLPIGFFPIYRFGRRMRRLSRQGQEAIGALSTLFQESVIGNKVVKIFGRERFEQGRFERENDALTATFVRSERVRALAGPVNEVLASFAICGVLLYGGFSVIEGGRTQGDFIAFLIAVFMLYDPFKKLSRVHSSIQQGMASADRIFEIVDSPPAIQSPSNPKPLPAGNELQFDRVSFAYKQDGGYALHDVSLTIPEGKKVALVGFSGAGKSTLVDLIPRFIDPTVGTVRIGGVDLREVEVAALRARIAMVGQHTFLFNDSIYNNIAYGKPDATREQVEAAARAAYAYDFITQLPQGFETKVGEGGHSLSGGERQRVAIARALLKDAPILILDEATASLDNRAEREVQSALEALERNRTTVVIAHRLSTVRSADRIVVLKEGRIVESGTHDELLKRGGEYSKLHALQFSDPAALESGAGEYIIN